MKKTKQKKARKTLPVNLATMVLTESGYRCAVPTCRGILALDMHHIHEVNADGPDELSNLIALCPTCHALFTRGTIKRQSINTWKAMLVALGRAFDARAIDNLLLLAASDKNMLIVSGDGVLHFAQLISSGLVAHSLSDRSESHGHPVRAGYGFYFVELTAHGNELVHLWKAGDRQALKEYLKRSAM